MYVHNERVHEGNHYDRVDDVRGELDAFSDSAANDGGRCSSEYSLEEPACVLCETGCIWSRG